MFGLFETDVFLMTTLGVIISIVLPILRAQLPGSNAQRVALGFWDVVKPYVVIGLFSIIASILVLAFINDPNIDLRGALLAGYAWDSTIQKIVEKS